MVSAERPHRPSRRLGQNFLKDQAIAARIVSSANLGQDDTVLEPGAGYGILTQHLLQQAGRVIAVEKDPYLASHLRNKFKNRASVEVVEGDFLEVSLPRFNKVVGTPPYYLSSKLILFLTRSRFHEAFLVLQKEFGERLLAQPGTRNFGRLSVTAQRRFQVESLMLITRAAFEPVPKVDSMLLAITPSLLREGVDNELFDELVRGIFTQRRRIVRGALVHYLTIRYGKARALATVEKMTVPELRVYQLSVGQLETLCLDLKAELQRTQESTWTLTS